MELKIWTKTLFSVYRCLEKLAGAIDKFVDIKAHTTICSNLSNVYMADTLAIAEKITNLTNKKISLINMKLLTEKILDNIPTQYARLIILKYIDNLTFMELSEMLCTNIRTIMRWHHNAIIESANVLKKLGFNDTRLHKLFGSETWLLDVYDEISERASGIKIPTISPIDIYKKASREYKLMSY